MIAATHLDEAVVPTQRAAGDLLLEVQVVAARGIEDVVASIDEQGVHQRPRLGVGDVRRVEVVLQAVRRIGMDLGVDAPDAEIQAVEQTQAVLPRRAHHHALDVLDEARFTARLAAGVHVDFERVARGEQVRVAVEHVAPVVEVALVEGPPRAQDLLDVPVAPEPQLHAPARAPEVVVSPGDLGADALLAAEADAEFPEGGTTLGDPDLQGGGGRGRVPVRGGDAHVPEQRRAQEPLARVLHLAARVEIARTDGEFAPQQVGLRGGVAVDPHLGHAERRPGNDGVGDDGLEALRILRRTDVERGFDGHLQVGAVPVQPAHPVDVLAETVQVGRRRPALDEGQHAAQFALRDVAGLPGTGSP